MSWGADGLELRELGTTGLRVTPVCIGGSPLGSMPQLYGHDTPAEQGIATARRTLEGPFNFLDTSNNYSDGESERRIGAALQELGGVPDGFVLATKVDRDSTTGDFSGERTRRSIEESRERLGLDRFQLVYLHDPEHISFEAGIAPDGPMEALLELKREGVIDHLGVAGGPIDLMQRYIATGNFAVVITHNRFTLVDRSAEPLFAACRCHDVPIAAAALQFSTRDTRIVSTIVGASGPERIEQTVELAHRPIPSALWAELAPLAAPREHWLN